MITLNVSVQHFYEISFWESLKPQRVCCTGGYGKETRIQEAQNFTWDRNLVPLDNAHGSEDVPLLLQDKRVPSVMKQVDQNGWRKRVPEVTLRLVGNESCDCTADFPNTGHARGNIRSSFCSFHRKWLTNYPIRGFQGTKNKKKAKSHRGVSAVN